MSEDSLVVMLRGVRSLYDDERKFRPGDRASLRAAKHPDDLLTDGAFWRLAQLDPSSRRAELRYPVLCFDAVEHAAGARHFAVSLRRAVYGDVDDADLVARSLRFRRLLASEDRAELVHHLRRTLRRAAQAGAGLKVDWGVLGADIVRWGSNARRRWAEAFFTARENNEQVASAVEGSAQ